jgi:Spy/CpxP family protein refolding chaperone
VNYWKVILATMVIFGAGVLTGGLVVRFVPAYAPQPQRTGNGPRFGEFGSPGGMRLEFLRRTQKELELTAQQREQIDKLIRQSQERTRKLMEPVAPQLHQELQRAKAEFREVLTPEQQTRFDQLLKQQQRFREHHGPNRFESGVTNTPATNSF